jgi:aldose 1-epimerase
MEHVAFEPNQLACYPLVPWSNRITEGGFIADGQHFILRNNRSDDPYPIHGTGWQRPWELQSHTQDTALLTLDDAAVDAYAFQASLHYALTHDTLQITLGVTNKAAVPMPFGLGLHPFFPRTSKTRLQSVASHVWLNDGCSPIPTEHRTVPAEWDFRVSRLLPDHELNHCFSGWQGSAVIDGGDLALELSADTDRFIVYTPVGADFFCFEPVDHVIDAMHRPGGALANGMTRLEPGQHMQRTFAFKACAGAAHSSAPSDKP